MTDAEINIAIARWMGWKPDATNPEFHMIGTWSKGGERVHDFRHLPDYCHDLNAIHEAERKLDLSQRDDYRRQLQRLVPAGLDSDDDLFLLMNATARQRSEALLRTLGLWKE